MAQAKREGREGSRWVNRRPDSKEVADWFATVPLHEGQRHEDFIHGIVLIEQSDKQNNQYYIPYPKVDVRIAYFHRLMALHPEWLGLIEPVGGDPAIGPGFTKRTVPASKQGKPYNVSFVCSTMRVVVYERESFQERVIQKGHRGEVEIVRTGKTVIAGAPATKMVALNNRYGDADPFSLMKAETGAVGRALGMAGMLIVPGAGVATAEDMAEAEAMEGRAPAPTPDDAALPTDEPQEAPEEALRDQARAALKELGEVDPAALEQFQTWAKEKKYGSLAEANALQLKGIVKKAQKDLDAAKQAAAEEATAEATKG